MTSGRTENIQHILKSCSVHLKDLASYVSRISDVTNFAMIILKNIFTNVNLNMIKWKILFSVQDKVFPTASKQSFDCVIIDSWYLIQNTLANRFSQKKTNHLKIYVKSLLTIKVLRKLIYLAFSVIQWLKQLLQKQMLILQLLLWQIQ